MSDHIWVLISTLALVLVACGDPVNAERVSEDGSPPGSVYVFKVDGRDCIAWKGGYAGGLSCNW